MASERESKTFLARLCEQAERYDEMVTYMKEETKRTDKHVSTIKEYRMKIELELEKVCEDVLYVLDEALIPNAATGESKVFYHKMKGDYHRYLAEFASGEKRKGAATAAHEAYKSATDVAQ